MTLSRVVLVASIVGMTGCVPPGRAPPSRAPPSHAPRVVLLTIDGVMWQDIFDVEASEPGRRFSMKRDTMPFTLAAVRARGIALGGGDASCGVVRTGGGANVSLPGYLEILTARPTRCRRNDCPATASPTLLDDAVTAGLHPVAAIGSWHVLDRAETDHHHGVELSLGSKSWVGTPPNEDSRLGRLVREGEQSEPFPSPDFGYRPDSLTSAIALAYIATARPRLIHVGLGDPDEYGHRDERNAYLQSLREVDDFVGDLIELSHDQGVPLTVVITPDHGRANDFIEHNAKYPESARTFFLAFGEGIAAKGEICVGHDLTLLDVGATVRAIVGLPALQSTSGEVVGKPIEAALTRAR